GCILHFHPSMRRANLIDSCDVSWISPFKHEREILFARSKTHINHDEKTHKEKYAWNAKVESEDEYTQMILLTWTRYDQHIQQTMQISAMQNHSIDLNLIYVAHCWCRKDTNETIQLLFEFNTWKFQENNKQKYKNRTNEFLERPCNHNINLFCMFLVEKNKSQEIVEFTTAIAYNGLPFAEKDKKI
ncbi:hypothetical protein RFI_00747, partial [Reticulomyxa filosa]